mgnify:CR=1 FL=1
MNSYLPPKDFMFLVDPHTGRVFEAFDGTDSGIYDAIKKGRQHYGRYVLVDYSGAPVDVKKSDKLLRIKAWRPGNKV